MKIYLGMAVHNASPEFKTDFRAELREKIMALPNVKLLDFIGSDPDKSPVDVYAYDMDCVAAADLCVFIVDEPSTGLGMEMAFRHTLNKLDTLVERNMLVFAHKSVVPSRMVTGMCAVEGIPFFQYQSVNDIIGIISQNVA